MSTPTTSLRIGDQERESAAEALGDHFAAGRLTQAELDERLRTAYAARTLADLQPLFRDLPEPHGPLHVRFPGPAPLPGPGAGARGRRGVPWVPVLLIVLGLAALTPVPFLLLLLGAVFLVKSSACRGWSPTRTRGQASGRRSSPGASWS